MNGKGVWNPAADKCLENFCDFQKLFRTLLWKFEYLSRVIFHNFSEWLHLRIPQQTKTCSNTTTKNDSRTALVNVIWVFLPNIFEVCDGEKLHVFYINGVCCCLQAVMESVLVKMLTFTVNGRLSSYCDSLFLAKPQVPIINGSDWVYDGACFYLSTVAVCF